MNEAERDELAEYLEPIMNLLQDFVRGVLDGARFESEFFRRYPDLPGLPSTSVFEAAERFFQAADEYVADPGLRDAGDLSTDDLRARAQQLLALAGLAQEQV